VEQLRAETAKVSIKVATLDYLNAREARPWGGRKGGKEGTELRREQEDGRQRGESGFGASGEARSQGAGTPLSAGQLRAPATFRSCARAPNLPIQSKHQLPALAN